MKRLCRRKEAQDKLAEHGTLDAEGGRYRGTSLRARPQEDWWVQGHILKSSTDKFNTLMMDLIIFWGKCKPPLAPCDVLVSAPSPFWRPPGAAKTRVMWVRQCK